MEGYFINLDNRKDRAQHIEKNIKCHDFFKDVKRFSAIEHSKGSVGCALSHINLLFKMLQMNHNYFMILEDDFQIIRPQALNDFCSSFNKIKDSKDWDIITLTPFFCKPAVDYSTKSMIRNNFVRIKDTQTTTGYIIKKSFIPVLINIWRVAINNLEQDRPYQIYAIDQFWKRLQTSYNFYAYRFNFAGQLAGYSDIEKMEVDYSIYYKRTSLF